MPEVLAALETVIAQSRQERGDHRLVSELEPGMVLAGDVHSGRGRLLVADGTEVTPSLIARLRNWKDVVGVKEPLLVRILQTESDGVGAPRAPEPAPALQTPWTSELSLGPTNEPTPRAH